MDLTVRIRSRKDFADKIAVLAWISLLFINVAANFIIGLMGGVGYIAVTYLLFVYFVLFYGRRKIHTIKLYWLWIFVIFYIIETQLFWNTDQIYYSMGISFKSTVWNLISFVPHTICAVQILVRSNSELQNWIRIVLKISLFAVCVATICILQTNSDIVRYSATGYADYVPFMANFGIVYGLAVTASYSLAAIKNQNRHKLIPVVWLIAVLICIFMCAYTIAIVSAILGICCYYLLNIRRKVIRYCLVAVLIIVCIFIYQLRLYEALLLELSSIIPIEAISKRLVQIIEFIKSGTVMETTSRFDMYKDTFILALKHPVFGNILWNPEVELSNHSTVLDIIAGCGLAVFIPFLKFISSVTRYQLNRFSAPYMRCAVSASALSFWFVCILNPIFASPPIMVLFILAPFLIKKPDGSSENDAKISREGEAI